MKLYNWYHIRISSPSRKQFSATISGGTIAILIFVSCAHLGRSQSQLKSDSKPQTSSSIDRGLVDHNLLEKLVQLTQKLGTFVTPIPSNSKSTSPPIKLNGGGLLGIQGQFFYASAPVSKNPNGFSPEQIIELRKAGIDPRKALSTGFSSFAESGHNSDLWLYSNYIKGNSGKKKIQQFSVGSGQFIKHSQYLNDHQLLLSVGDPYSRFGKIGYFLFDLKKNSFTRLGKFLVQFDDVQFSSDLHYAAFLQGPDLTGDTHGRAAYLTICDLRTDQEHIVAVGDSIIAGGWAWTSDDNLIFAYQPSNSAPPPYAFGNDLSATQKVQAHRAFASAKEEVTLGQGKTPNIYSVSLKTFLPKLLIPNAWRPVPSPDGKHLAFFGPEHPEQVWPLAQDWYINPHNVSLSVASTDNKKRQALNREDITYPTIIWRNPSQILSLKTDLRDGGAWGVVAQYDIEKNSFKRIAALKALDGGLSDRPLFEMPYFSDPEVSQNGKFLWVQVHEYGNRKANGFLARHESIFGVELDKNATFRVGHVQDGWGVAWNDQNSASPTPPVKPN